MTSVMRTSSPALLAPNVQRFVPPEDVYRKIHSRIRKPDDFEMRDWKMFDGPCDALHYELRRLERFSKPAAVPLILDVLLNLHDE